MFKINPLNCQGPFAAVHRGRPWMTLAIFFPDSRLYVICFFRGSPGYDMSSAPETVYKGRHEW